MEQFSINDKLTRTSVGSIAHTEVNRSKSHAPIGFVAIVFG
jgi:hypothetical protein